MNFIDLFAGAGGLSEGFMANGFDPIAHVEMGKEACDTIRTRTAYYHLKNIGDKKKYNSYLQGKISKEQLWKDTPEKLMRSVINEEISDDTIKGIFQRIDELLSSKKVDVLIGGPPCQAYSLVGRSRDPQGMLWDKRNFLFRYYAEFLKRYKPRFFVFENVLGLLTAGNSVYFKEMQALFTEIGYSVDFEVLKAEDYGVLQKRRRVIIIGRKGKKKFKFPTLDKSENKWQIKNDLFSDLPNLKHGEEKHVTDYKKDCTDYLKRKELRNGVDYTTQHITRPHNDRDLEIYSIAVDKWLNDRTRLKYNDLPNYLKTHKNTGAFLDRYKVVDPYGLSHTVVAHIAKDGHYYIYPDKKQIRSISVREAARIQSFPDNYFFEGGRTAAFRQIGNAVPPLMAKSIAESIKKII